MKTIARIEQIPLGQLVAATLSAMNVESDGYVIGEVHTSKRSRHFEVQALHLTQLTKRKPASVEWDTTEMQKISRFVNALGGFHSHLYCRTTKNGNHVYQNGLFRLSDEDVNSIKTYYPKGIELLAVMNPSSNNKKIIIGPHDLSGGIYHQGRNYHIQIGAFYLERGRSKRAELEVSEDDVATVFGS